MVGPSTVEYLEGWPLPRAMTKEDINRGSVTIAAGGDVGTGHKPPESAFAHVLDALGSADIRFPQYWAADDRADCAPMRAHTFYEPYEYQPGSPARIVTVPHGEDLTLLVEDVRRAKAAADVVVVSMHWGLHYIAKPLGYQTAVAHAAIDAGASVILGHHPHQQQGIEIYRDAIIFYILGNFAFQRRGGGLAYCMPNGEYTHKSVYTVNVDPGISYDYKRYWNESGIACVGLDAHGLKKATYVPTLLNDKGAPEIVKRNEPQFETTQRYLEWAAADIPGGVVDIRVENDRYVLFDRRHHSVLELS